MLVKIFKVENQGGKIFADTAGHWAKDYIAMAAAEGLVSGYDADTFGPNRLITREQMAVMITRAAQSDAEETNRIYRQWQHFQLGREAARCRHQ